MFDDDACYRALQARDVRFDGLFFVGISTTRIYCRPVCPARSAARKSCTFYPSAAAAESAGYRPCLRCRPEVAPSTAPYEARFAIASGIVARIHAGCLNGPGSVDRLAAEFEIGSRQLRRIVRDATGASPIELAQTARLLLAKQLLTETDLPVTRIALTSGFSSVRRFNEAFSAHYRLTPSRLRKRADGRGGTTLTLRLDYRPPFAWERFLAYVAKRTTACVEDVAGGAYRRSVSIGGHDGWVSVEPARHGDALAATVAPALAPVLQTVLARLRDLFDLHARPDLIDAHLAASPRLAPLVARRPGIRVPGAFDGFELAWRAILGQQVSVEGATTLAGRFANTFGKPIETPLDTIDRAAPAPEVVADASPRRIASIGIPRARARSLRGLARLCAESPSLLTPGSSVRSVTERLLELPGVGPWTAQYVTMRAMHWPDAFPESDLGLKRALGERRVAAIRERSEPWRPWRAYAAMHLWTEAADAPGRAGERRARPERRPRPNGRGADRRPRTERPCAVEA